jgi:hypothetical protein
VSRYDLPAAAAGLEVVVGWDPPLRTFFAQAWDRRLDEDDPAAELLWIGCSFGEIGDVEKVREAVAPWAQVPDAVIRSLYADAHGGAA